MSAAAPRSTRAAHDSRGARSPVGRTSVLRTVACRVCGAAWRCRLSWTTRRVARPARTSTP
eukprot:5945872-Prymnesium_polylepis.1